MNVRTLWLIIGIALVIAGCGKKEEPATPVKADAPPPPQGVLARGADWLVAQQTKAGHFGRSGEIGITGLALQALAASPAADSPDVKAAIDKAAALLLREMQDNGEVGRDMQALSNYRTSIAIMALAAVDPEKYDADIARARKFLVTLQAGGSTDTPKAAASEGGFSYDEEKGRADLSNTAMALDALKAAGLEEGSEVWKRAVGFLQRVHNYSEVNELDYALNDGGSIYAPFESKAGEVTLDDGRVVYSSYGSMTYALLKSYIFAGVDKDDPRIKAAVRWIGEHYDLDANPGLSDEQKLQGLYYYYYTMARALHAYGEREINGHPWASELGDKLVSLQKPEGYWINEADRWMEADPTLVTAYAMLALEICNKERGEPAR